MSRISKAAFVKYWLPALCMVAVIAGESTATFSGEHTGHLLEALLQSLNLPLTPHDLNLLNLVLRKIGHALGFGILSFLFFRGFRGSYRFMHGLRNTWRRVHESVSWHWRPHWALLAWVFSSTVAMGDELHQMTIPSRTGAWHDVLLDSCAALTVQVLILMLVIRSSRSE